MEDQELIKSILDGNKDNFELLVKKYERLVYQHCMRYTFNADDTKDLYQSVWLRIYQRLDEYNSKRGKFSTWCTMHVSNVGFTGVIAWNKRFKRFNPFGKDMNIDSNYVLAHQPISLSNPYNESVNKEIGVSIRKAVEQLPEKHKKKFVLFMEDKTLSEIAKADHCSIGTAYLSIASSKETLKKLLPSLL